MTSTDELKATGDRLLDGWWQGSRFIIPPSNECCNRLRGPDYAAMTWGRETVTSKLGGY